MAGRSRPATAVVGAGRLARALLPLLAARGYRPRRVASRPARGRRAPAVGAARLVLLAVPDRAIRTVAAALARDRSRDWSGRVVLHHAGALGTEPLEPLTHRGAAVGVLHPLQCFGGTRRMHDVLPGSRARIEGDPPARAAARRLARDLGLVPLRFPRALDADARAAYHAAGALVANDLVALVSLAVELLETTGLDRRAALGALGPLTRGTMLQMERGGLGGALTGPVPRGDDDTLRRHLDRLARLSPADADVHRLLSRRLARIAAAEGALEPRALRRLLRRTGPRSGRRI